MRVGKEKNLEMGLNWQNTIYNDRVLLGSPRYLMITLADKCRDSEDSFEIGMDKLAWLMNLKSTKQIKRLLDFLKSKKYLDYIPGDGRGKLTKIIFLFAQKKVDISEKPVQKKVDILEQDEDKGGHFETEKVDISEQKGGHSPAHANKDLLPPFTTVETTEEEAPPARQNLGGNRNGFPVNSTLSEFVQICLDGMKTRLCSPHTLPNQFEWLKKFEFFELNQSTPEIFLETFDLLEKIRKKKKAAWTIKPETIEKNFGKIKSLRNELEQLENGANNGQNQQNSNAVPGSGKTSNIQQVIETDYSEFADIEYPY